MCYVCTDSTVLAYVLKLLNERYKYGVELQLLSIDEGITGYRDDSLEVNSIMLYVSYTVPFIYFVTSSINATIIMTCVTFKRLMPRP